MRYADNGYALAETPTIYLLHVASSAMSSFWMTWNDVYRTLRQDVYRAYVARGSVGTTVPSLKPLWL